MASSAMRVKLYEAELEYRRRKASHFWEFSKAINPALEATEFHTAYYNVLNEFAHGNIKRLIVTVPPQHGKSEGSTRLLPAYLLGLNPNLKIAIASYSASLARKFSRAIQRNMSEKEYQRLFLTRLPERERGYTRTTEEFDLIQGDGGLKAVGRGGGLTGTQVDVMIMDDLYKDAMEGNSPIIRDSVIDWYNSVIKTRLHNNSRELIVFTRWHEQDLIGMLENKGLVKELTSVDDIECDYQGFYKINFEAIKEGEPTELDPRGKGAPLWSQRHNLGTLEEKRSLDPYTFECMYQGQPGAKTSYLYGALKEYSQLPTAPIKIANYTDTADSGKDFLCSVSYMVDRLGNIYVIDVVYTSEPMEATEPLVAQSLIDNEVRIAYIESNNGGRGFARNVQKLAPQTKVEWFHQSGNKEARILTNSANVTHSIYMPMGWKQMWSKFARSIESFRKDFKANKNDDAADVLTGIIEREIFISNSMPKIKFNGR